MLGDGKLLRAWRYMGKTGLNFLNRNVHAAFSVKLSLASPQLYIRAVLNHCSTFLKICTIWATFSCCFSTNPCKTCTCVHQKHETGRRKQDGNKEKVQRVLNAVSWLCWWVFLQVPCLTLPMSRDPTGEEGDARWSQQPHRWPPDGMFVTLMDL